uniref:Uncharacterized protein n=1 Tax=Macaca fascicularis TaxID=9541 RepID=Q9BE22_MACFA|nr:hypothetical protein [Macaca fascicularis]
MSKLVKFYNLNTCTHTRMAELQNIDNTKCWQGCGAAGTLTYCLVECRVVQPLWKTIWQFLRKLYGRAQWLMPVIPQFGKPRQADHLRSGVQNQPGQHGETLSLLKHAKLARRGGAYL